MRTRIDFTRVSMQSVKPLFALGAQVEASGLEHSLLELVKMRASQLNGCAYCLDMHTRDARAGGEDQRRLDVLSAWREAPELYSEREQAAFALTEAVTLISKDGVPDDVWSRVTASFDDKEATHLLMAIATISRTHRPCSRTRSSSTAPMAPRSALVRPAVGSSSSSTLGSVASTMASSSPRFMPCDR